MGGRSFVINASFSFKCSRSMFETSPEFQTTWIFHEKLVVNLHNVHSPMMFSLHRAKGSERGDIVFSTALLSFMHAFGLKKKNKKSVLAIIYMQY